jgi:hypothetical protein
LFGAIDAGSAWQGIATVPEFVWELSLGVWLIVKGFGTSPLIGNASEGVPRSAPALA